MWDRIWLGSGLVLVGCVGQPPPPPEMSTSGQTGGESGSTPLGSGVSGPGGSGGTSSGSVDGVDSSAGPQSSTTGTTGPVADPCRDPPPITIELDVTEGLITPPMQIGMLPRWSYAYSEQAEAGVVSFQFQVPCQDEFRVHAFIYDSGVGLDAGNTNDPDQFLVAFDGDVTTVWDYGCQALDQAVSGHIWMWLPVVSHGLACQEGGFEQVLSPGTHLLHLTNVEPGAYEFRNNDYIGEVAAVSRIVITSDPEFSPPQ